MYKKKKKINENKQHKEIEVKDNLFKNRNKQERRII